MTTSRTAFEIQQLARTGALVRGCFIRVAKELRPGVETAHLRQTADQFVASQEGSWSPPLPHCLTLVVNDRLLGNEENGKLESGDVITLDISAALHGWWADAAVTLPVGQIEESTGRMIRAAREVCHQSLSHLAAKVDWSHVALQTGEFAASLNLHLIESLFGHGIGRELHESPRLSWSANENAESVVLRSGMTVTIEPALSPGMGALVPTEEGGLRTQDGQRLFWFEETVAVTEAGCRVLTQAEIPPEQRNLVLIGMPGTGKSTVGHALSSRLGRPFVDLDTLIETQHGQRLEEIIHEVGLETFLDLEAEAAINFEQRGTVLATGGSVVYRPEAMLALQQIGTIVYLHTPLDELERRLSDLKQRGVVVEESQTVADLFRQREPLYECWYDLKIETAGHTVEETVLAIMEQISIS